MSTLPTNLLSAVRYFADRAVCHAYMRQIKWPADFSYVVSQVSRYQNYALFISERPEKCEFCPRIDGLAGVMGSLDLDQTDSDEGLPGLALFRRPGGHADRRHMARPETSSSAGDLISQASRRAGIIPQP